MTTAYKNDPPVCVSCKVPATCMRQLASDDPFEWEWHCNNCCTHAMEGDDPVCIPAEDVPMFYSGVDRNIMTWIRISREAIARLKRLTGKDMTDGIETLVAGGQATETCGGCNGTGRLSRWIRFFKRTCRRCDGLGEIAVPL